MKLHRLSIDGFGMLRGEFRFDASRVTLFVDDNERGKSTLLAAIVAALYGIPGDRRTGRPLTPLDRWRPWDGGAYGVELELECNGERLTVRRDFARGQVSVWNDRGRERTPEFLEGKDEYPVGKALLGLGIEEFEKCAFVRQEDLDQVVPAEERERRTNALQASLEKAADTRAGTSSAADAIRALDQAAARYEEPLLDTTIRVETAIKRLEDKGLTLDAELHALEHDYARIREPLARLVEIDDEERRLRERERGLGAGLRRATVAEARAKLESDRANREALEILNREAEAALPYVAVPHDADVRYREVVARLEAHAGERDRLDTSVAGLEEERAQLAAELESLAGFAALEGADADRFVRDAAELRRLEAERTRLGAALQQAAARLHALFEPPAPETLAARFDDLDDAARDRLDDQPRKALEVQAAAEREAEVRAGHFAALAEIDRSRRRFAVPGALLLVAAAAAGVFAAVPQARALVAVPLLALAVAAGALALGGAGLLIAAGAHRARERRAIRDRRIESEAILAEFEQRRREADQSLADLASATGCADAGDLLLSWNAYGRLVAAREPVRRLEADLAQAETGIAALMQQAGNPPDAAYLEQAAIGIRERLAKAGRLEEVNAQSAAARSQAEIVREHTAALEAKARAILAEAGLEPSAAPAWSSHTDELSERTAAARRYATLVVERIPDGQRRILTTERVAELERWVAAGAMEAGIEEVPAAGGDPVADSAAVHRELDAARQRLDALREERERLAPGVDEITRRYHREHPETCLEREAVDRALVRARRFKEAIDLARATIEQVALETHRRWADFLNVRVGTLLGAVGAGVEQVRFGEDLDFAVKPLRGQQVSRGKAVRQLSSGARDQLHLAVRLAISEYLSRDVPLPLLIDDCFVSSDDERARAGMKLLIEQLASRHRVVVVTCHRARYERLSSLDPGLYGDRVHWVDTMSLRTAAPVQARQG